MNSLRLWHLKNSKVKPLIEIETKIKLETEDTINLLKELIPIEIVQPRLFEDNYCFDYPDKILSKKGFLFRLRISEPKNILTLKGPSRKKVGFKIRQELELTLDNPINMLVILKKIGFKIIFRYQKYRTIYNSNGLKICFDETPIGLFLELEGEKNQIIELVNKIGLNKKVFIPFSYYYLFRMYKRKYNIKDKHMIFNK